MLTRTTPRFPADSTRLSESSPGREDSHAARRLKVAATITDCGTLIQRNCGRYILPYLTLHPVGAACAVQVFRPGGKLAQAQY